MPKIKTNADLVSEFLNRPVPVNVEGVGKLNLKRLGHDTIETLREDILHHAPLAPGASVEESTRHISESFGFIAMALAESLDVDPATAKTLLYQTGLNDSPLYLAMLEFAGLTMDTGDEGEGADALPETPEAEASEAPFC